jgi:peptide-methionine (R)-S-oxide reductase
MVWFFLWAACQSPASPYVAGGQQPSAVTRTDTLIPPQYDRRGQLVRLEKTDAQWRAELSELEYRVLRQEGTERAFTGDLLSEKRKGTFTCRGCGLPLFSSEAKFNSGTGWPSFWKPLRPEFIVEREDRSYGMVRTEVECARCGGHLGHVFNDGPPPTGLRYCINSVSLDFVPD